MLKELRRRFRLGIITNGPPKNQREEIAALGLDGLMDAVVVCGELPFRKPDPEAFLHACRLLDSPPGHTLMVGNSLRDDILPARKLGMPTVWIDRDGAGSEQYSGPTLRVATELPAWLRGSGVSP